jgi:hypothetical protein
MQMQMETVLCGTEAPMEPAWMLHHEVMADKLMPFIAAMYCATIIVIAVALLVWTNIHAEERRNRDDNESDVRYAKKLIEEYESDSKTGARD